MFHEDTTRVEEISKKRGISMAQVSLAWSLTRVTAPVVGSTSTKKLEDLIQLVRVMIWPVSYGDGDLTSGCRWR
jgi:aryl-alcohol dehydrogenase-like predicted oxidoreductase